MKKALLLFLIQLPLFAMNFYGDLMKEGLPLFWWGEDKEINFGDHLSLKLLERIVDGPVRYYIKKPKTREQKLLAIGSIFYFAYDNDVIWGSGINGKTLHKSYYTFSNLDVRAVRGPLTRDFLRENFNIDCPEIYGDPALLFPYFFPEFRRKESPSYEYLIIPHFSERHLFPKDAYPHVVYPTEPWDTVVQKILDSKLIISSSLHGIVLAESYGIPARYLRRTENENIFKYQDYYYGTGRPHFQFATSVQEALQMGGEPPFVCDLQKLYEAFPFEFWPSTNFKTIQFSTSGIECTDFTYY